MQKIAEWRYKAILEENTARSSGFKDRSEHTAKNIALKLLNENIDIKLISLVTGLSIDKIRKLK